MVTVVLFALISITNRWMNDIGNAHTKLERASVGPAPMPLWTRRHLYFTVYRQVGHLEAFRQKKTIRILRTHSIVHYLLFCCILRVRDQVWKQTITLNAIVSVMNRLHLWNNLFISCTNKGFCSLNLSFNYRYSYFETKISTWPDDSLLEQISAPTTTARNIFGSAWLCQQSSWYGTLFVVSCQSVRRPSVRVATISEPITQISFKF